MSKRNFILLIIILILAMITVLGYLYTQPKTIPTGNTSEDTNFISRFNPFRNDPPPPKDVETTTDSENNDENNTENVETPKLIKVSSIPVAGFTVFSKERLKEVLLPVPVTPEMPETIAPPEDIKKTKTPVKPTPPATEFAPALRYIERAGGMIYQTFADKIEERKFGDTKIPRIEEAYFGNHGESVVARYLKSDDRTIETFVSTLPKEFVGGDTTIMSGIKGSFLPNNITDISLSSDTSKIFYLFETGNSVIGTILNFKDNKKTQVFNSPFTEWLSWWPSDKMITLTTKPSANIPGYTYVVDPSKKNLSKILGNINGLTTLTNPSGKQILFGRNDLSLNMYDVNTGNSTPLGIKTLPEKCIWNKLGDNLYCAVPKFIDIGGYPDSWYQGEVSFNDQLWKIDVKNGVETMLTDPGVAVNGEEIDGIKLMLDDEGKYLLFINKKDSFLWELSLEL
jgi:hypothetical protein